MGFFFSLNLIGLYSNLSATRAMTRCPNRRYMWLWAGQHDDRTAISSSRIQATTSCLPPDLRCSKPIIKSKDQWALRSEDVSRSDSRTGIEECNSIAYLQGHDLSPTALSSIVSHPKSEGPDRRYDPKLLSGFEKRKEKHRCYIMKLSGPRLMPCSSLRPPLLFLTWNSIP
jgi:hypothetical protein